LVGALRQNGFNVMRKSATAWLEAKVKAGGVPAQLIHWISALDKVRTGHQPWSSETKSDFLKFISMALTDKDPRTLKLKDKLFGAIASHSVFFEEKMYKAGIRTKCFWGSLFP
jgi:hypothetical protein